jgi:uncharacterized membrane protein
VGRGIAVALALSLAANVFLGGFVAGKIAGGPRFHHGPPGFDMKGAGHEEFADLPPAARESLKEAFLARRADGADMRREARALHEEFVAVLIAEPWDRAAADAVVAKFEAAEIAGRAGMARLLVEAADGLSAEDRKALAKHLEKRGERRGRGRGGPPPD